MKSGKVECFTIEVKGLYRCPMVIFLRLVLGQMCVSEDKVASLVTLQC